MAEHRIQKRVLAGDTVVRFATLDEAARTCEFVASTETIDAHRSIVKQNWNLDRFRANPVILYCHDMDEPIGTAEARIESGTGLVLAVKFATDDPCAERVWNLVRQGVLRGMSVQFRPGKVGFERIGEADILVYDDCELLEASIVSVPSNPETLARDLALSDTRSTEPVAADVSFARKMIPHHEMAIEMANTLKRDGEDPSLLAMADDIIKSQTNEIKTLRAWLKANGLSARDLATDVANLGRSGVNQMSDKTEAPSAPPAPVPAPAPVAEVRSEPAPAPPPAASVAEVVSRSMHESALAALQGTISEQRTALNAAEARAVKAEAELKVLADAALVRKVEAFVGPKLLPTQRDAWLKLARESETNFDALIAMQPDLAVVGAPLITPDAAGTRATDAGASKVKRINDLTAERMKATGEKRAAAMRAVMAEHPELCTDD